MYILEILQIPKFQHLWHLVIQLILLDQSLEI